MEIPTTETVTERRGFIRRPKNTTVIIRAGGYSVLYDIQDHPDLVLKIPLPFPEFEQALEIEKARVSPPKEARQPTQCCRQWMSTAFTSNAQSPAVSNSTTRREAAPHAWREDHAVSRRCPEYLTTSTRTTSATPTSPGRTSLIDGTRGYSFSTIPPPLSIEQRTTQP